MARGVPESASHGATVPRGKEKKVSSASIPSLAAHSTPSSFLNFLFSSPLPLLPLPLIAIPSLIPFLLFSLRPGMSISRPAHATAVRWLTGHCRHVSSAFVPTPRNVRQQLLIRTIRTATHTSNSSTHYTTTPVSPAIRLCLKNQSCSSPSRNLFTAQKTPLSVQTADSNTPVNLRKQIKKGLWVGLGVGTIVSAVGIAWSPTYREHATIYSVAVFRSVATFVTGYLKRKKKYDVRDMSADRKWKPRTHRSLNPRSLPL